jgi:tRNA U34 5-carboxymethylaminomethyl modifying enzyme MnmG/GidA
LVLYVCLFRGKKTAQELTSGISYPYQKTKQLITETANITQMYLNIIDSIGEVVCPIIETSQYSMFQEYSRMSLLITLPVHGVVKDKKQTTTITKQ